MACDCEECREAGLVIRERYPAARAGLAPLGVALPEHPVQLGKGEYAVVFATDCDRVLKITSDLTERYASALAMRRPHPRLVRVDHVFSLGHHTVIVSERLERLDSVTRAMWPHHFGHRLPLPGELAQEGDDPEMWGVLLEIADAMRAAGITECHDLHQHNVMRRPSDGLIVVSDLGCSRSPVTDPLPLPLPGVECGDPGDCHEDPPAPPMPDPRVIHWPKEREAKVGDVFRVAEVDAEREWIKLQPQQPIALNTPRFWVMQDRRPKPGEAPVQTQWVGKTPF